MAAQVGDGEQDVAHLVFNFVFVATRNGGAQFGDLFFHLSQHVIDGGPVKSDRGGFFSLAMRTKQSGKGAWNAAQSRCARALFARFPRHNAPGVFGLVVSEDVGVPGNHFLHDARAHRVQREPAVVRCDLRQHQNHEQRVAQFAFQSVRAGVMFHGVEQFVDLFEQVRSHASQRLFPIPWAALGTPQAGHKINKLLHRALR